MGCLTYYVLTDGLHPFAASLILLYLNQISVQKNIFSKTKNIDRMNYLNNGNIINIIKIIF